MAYLFWTEFTASDMATCIIAKLRAWGFRTVLALFMTATAVRFQSVMTSAEAGCASAVTKAKPSMWRRIRFMHGSTRLPGLGPRVTMSRGQCEVMEKDRESSGNAEGS